MEQVIIILEKIKVLIRDMVDNVIIIYTDKGWEPFKKPLLFACPVLLVVYGAVYSPLGGKLRNRTMELEKLKLISTHAADYQAAKDSYARYQRKLPLLKDKDDWLSYVMTSTAKTNGIVIDTLSSQAEAEVGNFLLVSREATVTTTYNKLGKWAADMENSPILLKVSEMDLRKDALTGGVIKVSIKLATIFPRFGGTGPGAAGAAAATSVR